MSIADTTDFRFDTDRSGVTSEFICLKAYLLGISERFAFVLLRVGV